MLGKIVFGLRIIKRGGFRVLGIVILHLVHSDRPNPKKALVCGLEQLCPKHW